MAVFQADVLESAVLKAAAQAVEARFGPPTLPVNTAAGNQQAATSNAQQRLFDLPEEALRAVLDLNLLGTLLPCRVFGHAMAAQRRGGLLRSAKPRRNALPRRGRGSWRATWTRHARMR